MMMYVSLEDSLMIGGEIKSRYRGVSKRGMEIRFGQSGKVAWRMQNQGKGDGISGRAYHLALTFCACIYVRRYK